MAEDCRCDRRFLPMPQPLESTLGEAYTVRGRQCQENCEERCLQKTADRVQIRGIRSQPWLNGKMARVLPGQDVGLRVHVQLEGTSTVKSVPWPSARRMRFRSGDRVVVVGISSIDGRSGQVVQNDDGIQRLSPTSEGLGDSGLLLRLDGEEAHRSISVSNLQLDIECPICLEDMPFGHVRLPCEHKFHHRCITRWSASRVNECPLCRQEFGRGAVLFEDFPADVNRAERQTSAEHLQGSPCGEHQPTDGFTARTWIAGSLLALAFFATVHAFRKRRLELTYASRFSPRALCE
mmetsp:Transcript_15464/g.42550  ORF Transcript_15464/g.42550 Transcript_15464/m.42550 type:complete len:293 (-) Transcript_15464:90-968(-)